MIITPKQKNTPGSPDPSLPSSPEQSGVNVGQNERVISALVGAGLVVYGLIRRDRPGALLGVAGAGLLLRGASGRSPVYTAFHINTARSGDTIEQLSANVTSIPGQNGIEVRRTLTINRSAEELYTFWRQVEKAPLYMPHVESVLKTGERSSHWLASGPGNKTLEWNSEILEDEPNYHIAWHVHGQTPGPNAGEVIFEPATGKRGTVVTLYLKYLGRPPLTQALGKLFWRIPDHETLETLRRFKELMEAGEIPTTKGQPTGNGRK